jgi:uncharacterized membrane protein
MTWTRFSFLGVVCTLLFALGAGAASGHEAHRKAVPVTVEATEVEPAPQPPEPPAEVSVAAADSASTHQPHAPADAPPEPEAVSVPDWLGRLHPMVIHFPIALFLAALVAELLFASTRLELFRNALRFCLWGAAMSAAIAAPLGWMFAASGATEEGWILEAHRWSGIAASLLGLAVLWIVERAERAEGSRVVLRVLLALQALLIGGVGFLGGSLLYGLDHFWRGL